PQRPSSSSLLPFFPSSPSSLPLFSSSPFSLSSSQHTMPLNPKKHSRGSELISIPHEDDPEDDFQAVKKPPKTPKAAAPQLSPDPLYADQERIFANMRLRRILKENHGRDVNQLAFHFNIAHYHAPVGINHIKRFDKRGSVQRDENDTSNVLATVGGAQANIYDNEHCGDHLDVMSHFNLDTEESLSSKKEMNTLCWLHRDDDALLAIAGCDAQIHILSLAHSRELIRLEGHTKAITDLHPLPRDDDHLLSASRDGTVRLWSVESRRCLAVFDADATVLCPHPSGASFLTGGAKGEIRRWPLPEDLAALLVELREPTRYDKKRSVVMKKFHGENQIGGWHLDFSLLYKVYSKLFHEFRYYTSKLKGVIATVIVIHPRLRLHPSLFFISCADCIRYANGQVLSKSINGRVEYWDPVTMEVGDVIRSFRVKTAENFCRFDVRFVLGLSCFSFTFILAIPSLITHLCYRRSLDESFFCVGTSGGAVHVYSLHTGRPVAELQHRRSTKAVRCCVFSRDCRTIIAAGEDSVLWRYDYVDDATLQEWAGWRKADG
ncbi:WD40-repeat-containing domain protein, partial [Endogone sp. FLAS-F59071]